MRKGGVSFWAWMISVTVHLVALTAFGIARFSHSPVQSEHYITPTAEVSRVKKLLENIPLSPKPKMKKAAAGNLTTKKITRLPAMVDFEADRINYDITGGNKEIRPAKNALSMTGDIKLPRAIEFFGSRTQQRKICYVVDCSGSMKGILASVKSRLKDSLSSLQPDQYFSIIFFGGNKLSEFREGKLTRATKKNKSDAFDFIDSAKPAGQTNALRALEKALQVRDSGGQRPGVIYFLTDGFELTAMDAQMFPQKVMNLIKQVAPKTKINTIGFWPQGADRKMLELIAKQSNGEYVIITDVDNRSK